MSNILVFFQTQIYEKTCLGNETCPCLTVGQNFSNFPFLGFKKKPCDYVTTPFNAKFDPTFPENCGEMQKIFKKLYLYMQVYEVLQNAIRDQKINIFSG